MASRVLSTMVALCSSTAVTSMNTSVVSADILEKSLLIMGGSDITRSFPSRITGYTGLS